MACPRVGVIDSAASVRETIAIVLGDDYAVQGMAPEAYIRDPSRLADAHLLIIEQGALPPETVAALIHGPPVLWLHDRLTATPSEEPQSVLSRQFTPSGLRDQVSGVLTPGGHGRLAPSAAWVLEYPFLPHEASVLAGRAVSSALPVLFCGEPGTGKARLARALHSIARASRFLTLSPDRCSRAALLGLLELPGDVTVFVDHVQLVDRDGQQFLLELLDSGGLAGPSGWHRVRLIGATLQTFEGLGRLGDFDRELYYRLSVLPVRLPPLRERAADIPALAATLAEQITRQLAAPAVSFTPGAIERLSRYLWFGNVAELETVLARSIALAPHRMIEVDDLLFGYGRLIPHAATHASSSPTAVAESPQTGTVDLVINELAHEFKNPMVTIKTISQHLERLLADEAGRQHVAQLTGEAVDRMDRALENMLQFTRFQHPSPRRLPLNALLAPCLSEIAALLTERRVVLNYQPPEPLPVYVDPEQIVYAIENLLRAVVRDLEEGETVTVRAVRQPVGFTVDFNSAHHLLAEKLARFLDTPHASDEPALPLGLVFAKTLIERNGGSLVIRSGDGRAVITVELPEREGIVPANGKTASSRS